MIGIYGVLVPCGYTGLLLWARRAIVEGEHTPLSDALASLHDGAQVGLRLPAPHEGAELA